MNKFNYTTPKQKNKHLTYDDLNFIRYEYNHYMSSKVKVIKKTDFMRNLANRVGTCLSNLYKIIKDGLVELLTSNYDTRIEFSEMVAYAKRKTFTPNNSKFDKAKDFIILVENTFKKYRGLVSIESIINDLKLNHSDLIEGMPTISVKTFYNYVHNDLSSVKLIDLPIAVKRKRKIIKKTYLKTKGTSIEERPERANDRSEFGHWEGDTVIGKLGKNESSIFTLVERKTRFYITMKLKHHTSNDVYRAINKLEKKFGDKFSKLFKSITFDNGIEFSRFKDIEKKKGSSKKRTTVYFAHPYSSFERGSNERHNRFLRFFIKKYESINNYSIEQILKATKIINHIPKKVLKYKSSRELFNLELKNL